MGRGLGAYSNLQRPLSEGIEGPIVPIPMHSAIPYQVSAYT